MQTNKEKIALLRAQLSSLPTFEGEQLITAIAVEDITGIPSQTVRSRILARGITPKIDFYGLALYPAKEIITAFETLRKAGRKARKEAK